MKRMIWIVGLSALALAGCSGDDEETPAACTGDAGDCVDGGAGTGTGGGGGSGGTGGSGGATGGMGGSGGATGGTGGTTPDEDGGDVMMPEEDASMPMPVLPTDGNQGSVCDDVVDCNQGLDCYDPGTDGQGYCSSVCEDDGECEAIDGASYRCSMSTGVCIVECEGEDDDDSCPENMVCVNTAGFGGGPGMPAYRCKYPDAPPPAGTAQAFEACSMDEPCVEGLVCNAGFGGSGYCTAACELPDGDCSAVEDAAGELTAECAATFGGPGGMMGRCVLDCSEDEDGCPDGLSCIQAGPGPGGGAQRCGIEP